VPDAVDLRARLVEYVDAVNSRDASAIADQFSPDAVHADPVTNPPHVGRAAITAFFQDGIAASDHWRFSAPRVHTCGALVAIDFEIAVVTGGQTVTISGIEVFCAGEDGRFVSAHAYWDENDVTVDAQP